MLHLGNLFPLFDQEDKNNFLSFQFSASVESALQSTTAMTENLKNEMVRDVCCCILSYTRYPSKSDRVTVAKLMVKTYPILADKTIGDSSVNWVRMFFCIC